MYEKRPYADTIDHAISALAARQNGNVTRGQLSALGLGAGAIKYRVRTGVLHPFPSGVYGVGRPATTDLERAAAVVLACGPKALLSHASALALWELVPWPDRLEVTVPTRRNPHGVTTHRCSTLTDRDIRHRQRIPLTSPARTLLDVAPRLTDRQLTRLVNDALRRKLLTRRDLRELLVRCGGHLGRAKLATHADDDHSPTASHLEDDFVRFCADHGLPQPLANHVRPDGRRGRRLLPRRAGDRRDRRLGVPPRPRHL